MTDRREDQIDQIIAGFLESRESGAEVTSENLIADHPEFAGELQDFFDNLDRFDALPRPLAAAGATRKPILGDQRLFGDYELLEEVARGGMGIVYKARQVSLNRTVAVKMIAPGSFAGDDDLKRFQGEAEVVANLRHPNIVSVHEVGCHAGHSYFSMDFIDGEDLGRFARDNPLSAQKVAKYVRDIALAIDYAHRQGILHRDVKPSNVLIDQNDSVHITDFGLAMRVEGDSELTRTGQVLGTPGYMPPEQAENNRSLIGPASDVYSIGALFYEMLTGRPPFRAESPLETLKQVVDSEPVSPKMLNPTVPTDLETICLKCLEKEPHRRYPTGERVANDLERFLNGDPISARPIGRVARAWRWCARRPVIAGLSASVILLVVCIGFVSTASYFITRSAWLASENNAEKLERNLYFSEMTRASNSALNPDGLLQVARIVDKWDKPTTQRWRDWEWHYLSSLIDQEVALLKGHQGNVSEVEWDPDGTVLASAGEDGTIRLWSDKGQILHKLTRHAGSVRALAWVHEGTQIAAAVGDGTIQIWDAEDGQLLKTIPHSADVLDLAWNQERQQLAVAHLNPSEETETSVITLWDGTEWRASHMFGKIDGRCSQLCWHPVEPLLGAADATGKTIVWDIETKAQRSEHDGQSFRWNHDGSLLATRFANNLRISRMGDDRQPISILGDDFAWHPNEPILAYLNRRRLVTFFDVSAEADIHTLRGDQLLNLSLCWHPEGHRIATCGADGDVRIWNASRPAELTPGSAAIAWNPDGTQYVSRIRKEVVIFDRSGSRSTTRLGQHEYLVYGVSWSPDGKWVASASYDGEMRIWNAKSGDEEFRDKTETIQKSGISMHPAVLSWSPDSGKLAFPQADKIGIVDLESEQVDVYSGHSSRLRTISWSPSGSEVASAGDHGDILIWSPETQSTIQTIESTPVNSITWDPAGRRIAGACGDGNTRVWDSTSGELIRELYGHVTYVQSVAWHPDGKRIASAAESGDIFVWDADAGNQALVLKYNGGVPMIAWSPDGKHLAAVGYGGNAAVRIWSSVSSRSATQFW